MPRLTADELSHLIALHRRWLRGEEGGTRAVLRNAVLTRANLTGAVLRNAVLTDADLTGAVLRNAVLTDADLTGAVLRNAVLTRANLTGAVLRNAVLRNAVLRGAVLTGADLTGAVLAGADIPVVPHIDAAILAAIEDAPETFNMRDWHNSCGTTHCRAGWAITLAGDAGRDLESKTGPCAAGALIYAASRPGKPVPDFYATTEDALADLRACAEEDVAPC